MPGLDSIIGNIGKLINFNNPIGLVVSIIVSTIVGGIVYLIIAKLIGGRLRDSISIGKSFSLILVINLINMFGLLGFVLPYIGFLPLVIIQILVWVLLTKIFLGIPFTHAGIIGVVGYVISGFAVPALLPMVSGLIPV